MLKYISLLTIILVLFIGCAEKPKVSNPTFEISPSATTVPVGVEAKFTIIIPKAPYSLTLNLK